MTQKERENFYRYSTIIVDNGKEALVLLLQDDLANINLTLVDFINQHQHDIYHLCYNRFPCCQCVNGILAGTTPRNRIIHPDQLDILLDKTGPKLPGHNLRNTSQFCCCIAKRALTTACLDITLTRCLLINFATNCPAFSAMRQAVEDLVQCRNKLYGHAEEAKITDADFNRHRTDIQRILFQIARHCNVEDKMRQSLQDVQRRPLDETICIQYQITLLDEMRREKDTEKKIKELQQQIIKQDRKLHSRLDTIETNTSDKSDKGRRENTTSQKLLFCLCIFFVYSIITSFSYYHVFWMLFIYFYALRKKLNNLIINIGYILCNAIIFIFFELFLLALSLWGEQIFCFCFLLLMFCLVRYLLILCVIAINYVRSRGH